MVSRECRSGGGVDRHRQRGGAHIQRRCNGADQVAEEHGWVGHGARNVCAAGGQPCVGAQRQHIASVGSGGDEQ